MSRKPTYEPGEQVAGWRLLSLLGLGGNAEVWHASNGESEVALKILRQRRPESEPYRRFQREVETLQTLGPLPGILPLVGSEIPSKISRASPAWLAMPVAEPLKAALGDPPLLRPVVEAIASVAATLARLEQERGIHHRDIKPENLYSYRGAATIGDFGLVQVPDADSLTAEGSWVGPLYYLAPEVLNNPDSPPGPGDVFALAKTLWVLATGQRFPLPGHMPSDIAATRLGSGASDAGMRQLERLIDRSTAIDPADRPTMIALANELKAWLAPPKEGSALLDIEGLRSRVFSVVQIHAQAEEAKNHRREYVLKKLDEVTATIRTLGESVRTVTGLLIQVGAYGGLTDNPQALRLGNLAHGEYLHHVCFLIQSPGYGAAGTRRVELAGGLAIAVTNDRFLHIQASHVITIQPGGMQVVWTETRVVPMESALEVQALSELLEGLQRYTERALLAFTSALDGTDGVTPSSA